METSKDKSTNKGQLDKPQEPPANEKVVGGISTQNVPISTQNEEITEIEKKEKQTTIDKKRLFLEVYGQTLGSVKATCAKVGIERHSYRRWRDTDPEFEKAITEKWKDKLEDVEQQLNNLILEKDGPSVRYFLDRRSPDFRPKVTNEITPLGSKTAKELLDDLDKELDDKNEDINTTTEKGEEGDKTESAVPDQKQEGAISPIQNEHSTEVLLEKKDETKPDSESAPKGDLKDNRRRPVARLHTERN